MKSMGVVWVTEGETTVVAEQPERYCKITLQGSDLRVQGALPRHVRKDWLGKLVGSGYVGMSPLAIPDFVRECEAERIVVRFDEAAQKVRDEVLVMMRRVDAVLAEKKLVNVSLAAGSLRSYQQEAIAFGEATGGRFLVHYDVGTGKTAIGIAWRRHSKARRTLVICPSIAKGNWKDEVQRFDGSVPVIIDGFRQGIPALPNTPWVILGMDVIMDTDAGHKGWLPAIRDWQPDLVIVDESHYIRGAKALRSEGVRAACKASKHAILMTGTAMSEGPIDLWSQLDALQPRWWGGSWFDYALAFCNARKKFRRTGTRTWEYWDMSGASNADVLKKRLQYVMIRKTVADVKLQLPPQARIPLIVPLSPTSRHQYDETLVEYREFLSELSAGTPEERDAVLEMNKGKRLSFLMKLRRLSSAGRVPATVDEIAGLVEQGKRPVVFAYFTDSLQAIHIGLTQRGIKAGYIDGDTSSAKRNEIRKAFVAGKFQVLVGQIETMGVAINLQEASDVTLTHDLTYRPIDLIQSEGRIWRSGQEKPVIHYYSIGEDTKDDRILDVLLNKMANIEAVHAGTVTSVEGEVLHAMEHEFFYNPRMEQKVL